MALTEYDKYLAANRVSWDKRTPIHAASRFYDVEGFKTGKSSLNFIEVEELGPVKGQSLLHLQCHFGMDSLSWARMGARVTGIDFSEKSIQMAKELGLEENIHAEFHCCDVYDVPMILDNRQFDIVFTSYGAINWLPDIDRWAQVAAQSTKRGGTFYMVEFHPLLRTLDEDGFLKYSYFHREEPYEDPEGTYTDGGDLFSSKSYDWQHSMSDVVNALIGAGFRIELVNEFPFSVYNCFPGMIEIEPGKWVFENVGATIPYLFSVRARRG